MASHGQRLQPGDSKLQNLIFFLKSCAKTDAPLLTGSDTIYPSSREDPPVQGSGKTTSQAKTLDNDMCIWYTCPSQSGCERLRIYRKACGKERLWEKHVRPNTNG